MVGEIVIEIIEEKGFLNASLRNEKKGEKLLMGSIMTKLVCENAKINRAFTKLMIDCAKHVIEDVLDGEAKIVGIYEINKPVKKAH